jgi:hemolysin-activating ACP:hemolysin acyltransferase
MKGGNASGMSVQQVRDANAALGVAATYVASHPPFGSYRTDKLVGSLAGQIRRGHYAFAVRDGIIVGYVGWALCQPDIAKAWIEHGQTPTFEQNREGDVVVPIIVIADDRSVLRQLAAYMRRQHGGKPYMGRRVLREVNAVRAGRLGKER